MCLFKQISECFFIKTPGKRANFDTEQLRAKINPLFRVSSVNDGTSPTNRVIFYALPTKAADSGRGDTPLHLRGIRHP